MRWFDLLLRWRVASSAGVHGIFPPPDLLVASSSWERRSVESACVEKIQGCRVGLC
jgi:hypothetical protein